MYKNLKKWMEETYPEGEPSEEEWDEIAYEDENPPPARRWCQSPLPPSHQASPLTPLRED